MKLALMTVLAGLAATLATGCFGTSSPGSSGATGGAGGTSGSGGIDPAKDPLYAQRKQCLDKINAYRDTLNLPHYTLWTGESACADNQAKSDSQSGKAHGAFGDCGESAQNECPGWNIDKISSASGSCLDMMWAEGPGTDFSKHGHYLNMSSTQYTKVACGFSAASGTVWAVQDFK